MEPMNKADGVHFLRKKLLCLKSGNWSVLRPKNECFEFLRKTLIMPKMGLMGQFWAQSEHFSIFL